MPPMQKATPEMIEFLKELRKVTHIGMVGGSDLVKQKEQLGDDGEAPGPRQLLWPVLRV